MTVSLSVLTLVAELTLALFLGLVSLLLWRIEREDRTPLWMAAWLAANAVFALCRLLQYAPLTEQSYILIPRLLLTAGYIMAWFGYELANAFIAYRPRRSERFFVISVVGVLIVLIWAGNLILTDQTVLRTVALGGQFHGVLAGPLYLPASLLILGLGAIPLIRLLRVPGSHRRENVLLATGFGVVILFSLVDFLAVALNLSWIRLSDYGYLLVGILYGYIQIMRYGRLYGEMNSLVEERTQEVSQANNTLRASEDRYRKLIDTARDVIFSISVDGKFTLLNPSFEIFTGWPRAEWLGRPFEDLIIEKDKQSARELFERVLRTETVRAIRVNIPTRMGDLLVVELNLSPQIRDGKVVGLLGIARDMTEEQRAEDALRLSEERYRRLFENNPLPMWIYDLKTLSFLTVNDAAIDKYGYSRDEFLGMTIADIRPTEDVPLLLQHAAGDRPELQHSGIWRHRLKDGSIIQVDITSHTLTIDDQQAALVVAQDVTDRLRAEEQAQLSQWRLVGLVNSAMDAVISIDSAYEIVLFNPAAERMFGYKAEEVLGLPLEMLLPERFRTSHTGHIQSFGETGITARIKEGFGEVAGKRRDGGEFPLEVSISQVDIGGEKTFTAILRDISERKSTEQSLQRQLREMIALDLVATAGAKATDTDELIQSVTHIISEMLYPDNCGVLLLDEITGMWKPHPSYQGRTTEDSGELRPLSIGIGGKAMATGRAVRVGDISREPVYLEVTSGIQSEMAVPILVNGKVFGCLNIESRQTDAFSEHDERLMSTIVESVSTAIEKISLLEVEKRRRRQAEILYDTTRDLAMERDLPTLLQIIVERATGMLGATSGGLYLCEPEQRRVRCVVSHNTGLDYVGVTLKYGEGAAGRVAETGEPLIIDDYRLWEGRAEVYEQAQPFISILSVPMRRQDDVIGVIHVLENSRPRAFTQEDLQTLALFANQATIAIENSRLFETEQRRRREADAIAEIGRDISATLQLDLVLQRIASHAKELLRAETSAVYLAGPTPSVLLPVAAIGVDAEEIKNSPLQVSEGILGQIAQQRSGEIVNDTMMDPRSIVIDGTEATPLEHLMGVPVLSDDQLTGLIAVWRTGEALEFKSTELDLLARLAGQVAVAIENARLFEASKKRLREVEGLARAGAALGRTLELEPLLENILQAAISAIPAAQRGSFLLADEKETLHIRAVWGYADPRVRAISFSSNSGYSSLAFRERRGLVVPDVRADPEIRYEGDIQEMLRGGSAIAVPLVVKDRPIGVLALDTPLSENAFNEDDLHLLTAMSASAAVAIENARLFENTRQRLAEIEGLHAVSTSLRSAQTLDEALPIILDQLMQLLNAGGASLEMVDPASGEIVAELAEGAWAGVTGLRTPPGAGVSGKVISTGQPYVSDDAISDGMAVRPDLFAGLHSIACVPVIAQHQPIGTLWIGRQTPILKEEVSLLFAIGEMVGSAIHRMKLHMQTERLLDDLQDANVELSQAYDTTLEGWAKALELRDKETEGHSRRVTDLTVQLAQRMGISEPELTNIRRGVLLHDIGKMGLTDQLLRKTAPLTEDEWGEMRKHPDYAFQLLYPIAYLRAALDVPYCHHEKWDGTGYPRGLKGKQIPISARIFAVVDVYDALLNDRPYRAAWPRRKVLNYLREQAGKHFDPNVVDAFLGMLRDKRLVGENTQ